MTDYLALLLEEEEALLEETTLVLSRPAAPGFEPEPPQEGPEAVAPKSEAAAVPEKGVWLLPQVRPAPGWKGVRTESEQAVFGKPEMAAWTERERPEGQETEPAAEAGDSGGERSRMLQRESWTEETLRRPAQGTAELLQAMDLARRAAVLIRKESGTTILGRQESPGVPGGWDPAELDQLIRRDARRYDGGFTLY